MRRQHHRRIGNTRQPMSFQDRINALFRPGVRAPEESHAERQRRRFNRSCHQPHQGTQECARRRRQVERGILPPAEES